MLLIIYYRLEWREITFDKNKQKKLYKISRKISELYELIRENNTILNIDAITKLKSTLNKIENYICYECRYYRSYVPYRHRYCRRNYYNYKDYGGRKEYWRNAWTKITGKKN